MEVLVLGQVSLPERKIYSENVKHSSILLDLLYFYYSTYFALSVPTVVDEL